MTRTVPIAEVAQINPPPPRELFADAQRPVSFVPMAQLGEDGRLHNGEARPIAEVSQGYTYFADGDVIVAKITPCLQNGKAALVEGLEGGHGFGSTEFHVLRPGSSLDGRYLFYMIWNPLFRHYGEQRFTGSAGQKRVPASAVAEFALPLPFPDDPKRSLAEQKRIAAILDKADAIRRRRQEALDLVDPLLQSTFMEIVGPGAADFGKWAVRNIESLASPQNGSMRTGPFGSDLRHSEFVDSGIAVLGIDNAVQNKFAWDERRYITPEKYERLRRYTVFPNDVIITIMGTIGRSAVVPEDIPTAITTKHLASITLNREVAEPEFVSNAIHRHPEILRQLGATQRGAIMSGLNLGIIKGLQLPVPPIDVQREFAAAVKRVRTMEDDLSARSDAATDLFNSLVQRAFRGGL